MASGRQRAAWLHNCGAAMLLVFCTPNLFLGTLMESWELNSAGHTGLLRMHNNKCLTRFRLETQTERNQFRDQAHIGK